MLELNKMYKYKIIWLKIVIFKIFVVNTNFMKRAIYICVLVQAKKLDYVLNNIN